ncbi:MAG TPA: ADP-glyceromanno-heptose 6-epimerase [Acidobacteriaceae bacterium]
MGKQIVVTGAAGFIGRNIVAELNRRGHDDLILVDLLGTDDKWRNLVGLRYEEILSPDFFLSLVEGGKLGSTEAIIHLGACSATTERDADYLLRNNYHYTRTLCEWSLKNDTRFVYASSAATYGEGAQGYSDADSATLTLHPLNMYGYSKHMFDLWALKHELFNKIVGLKYFNVFGPYEDHKNDMRSVVSKSYQQIKATGKVQLFKSYRPEYADGEQMRDFVYVKDAVAVTLHFALSKGKGGLFNCGTGKARTWKDLVTAVYTAMNLQQQIEFIPMPEQLRGKYQYFTEAEMTKLRSAGYKAPFHTLEDAVKDYIVNYYEKLA